MRALTIVLLLALTLPAAAQTGTPEPAAQNTPAKPFVIQASQANGSQASNCVDVEVNGYRSRSYNCLEQQLSPTINRRPDNPGMASLDAAGRPSNQLGMFNQSSTSNRMGNTFGTSVYPQRPPAPVFNSPVIHR